MHSFALKAPHVDQLLKGNKLADYVKSAAALAKTPEAIRVFEAGDYKDFKILNDPTYKGKQWSAHYFGGAIEVLAETFFEVFGAKYNIQNFKSTDDFDDPMEDTGVDHFAESIFQQRCGNTRVAQALSPVYIQTKGTVNPRKEFTSNDGARLPNFFMNAQARAIASGHAYTARYILFTTAKGLHYRLKANSGDMCEIINYNAIRKLTDSNVSFWNKMREKMNVETQEVPSSMDPEAAYNVKKAVTE